MNESVYVFSPTLLAFTWRSFYYEGAFNISLEADEVRKTLLKFHSNLISGYGFQEFGFNIYNKITLILTFMLNQIKTYNICHFMQPSPIK